MSTRSATPSAPIGCRGDRDSSSPPSSSRARAIEAKRKPARSRAITACERLFLGYESRNSYERASYRKPAIEAVDALLAAVHEAEGKTTSPEARAADDGQSTEASEGPAGRPGAQESAANQSSVPPHGDVRTEDPRAREVATRADGGTGPCESPTSGNCDQRRDSRRDGTSTDALKLAREVLDRPLTFDSSLVGYWIGRARALAEEVVRLHAERCPDCGRHKGVGICACPDEDPRVVGYPPSTPASSSPERPEREALGRRWWILELPGRTPQAFSTADGAATVARSYPAQASVTAVVPASVADALARERDEAVRRLGGARLVLKVLRDDLECSPGEDVGEASARAKRERGQLRLKLDLSQKANIDERAVWSASMKQLGWTNNTYSLYDIVCVVERTLAKVESAERERDTALARVREIESALRRVANNGKEGVSEGGCLWCWEETVNAPQGTGYSPWRPDSPKHLPECPIGAALRAPSALAQDKEKANG